MIQERVSDLNVLIMRMFECGSEHDMLLRRDSIDVDYDFISCIKRIQSYPYIGASTLEKALSTLYMCGGLFDKTVFSEYDNSVLLMMPGIYTNLVSDCIAARIFDYNYLNRARIKKFSIYVKGSSDARRKVISQHTPIGLVVDMKSSMKKSDTSSRVGMFVQNDSNIVLQNDV